MLKRSLFISPLSLTPSAQQLVMSSLLSSFKCNSGQGFTLCFQSYFFQICPPFSLGFWILWHSGESCQLAVLQGATGMSVQFHMLHFFVYPGITSKGSHNGLGSSVWSTVLNLVPRFVIYTLRTSTSHLVSNIQWHLTYRNTGQLSLVFSLISSTNLLDTLGDHSWHFPFLLGAD